MGARFEERITIAAPAQKVYDYVSDFHNHEAWSANRTDVVRLGLEIAMRPSPSTPAMAQTQTLSRRSQKP